MQISTRSFLSLTSIGLFFAALLFLPVIAFAQPADNQTPAQEAKKLSAGACSQKASTNGLSAADAASCVKDNPIIKKLQTVINFLAIGVGVVATISIIFAGIQYITGGDNPQQLQNAKNRIIKTITAVIVFIFMWAILNWLLPGGRA